MDNRPEPGRPFRPDIAPPSIPPKPTDTAPPTTSPQPAAVTPEPTPPVPPTGAGGLPPTLEPPRTKRRLKSLIIAALGLLLVLGGGAFAYFGVVVQNRPEKIVSDAMANLFTSQSADFTAVFNLDSNDQDARLTLSAKVSPTQFDGTAELDFGLAALNAEARYSDKNAYFRLTELDQLSSLISTFLGEESAAALMPVIAAVDGQWYEISEVLFDETGLKLDDLTEDDRATIRSVLGEHEILNIVSEHPDATVNDRAVYVYDITLNQAELINAVKRLDEAGVLGRVLEDEPKNELMAELEKAAAAEDESTPIRLSIYKDKREIAEIYISETEDGATAELTWTFNRFNEPFSVAIPPDAEPIMNLFVQIGSLFQSELEGGFEDGIDIEGLNETDDGSEFIPAVLGELLTL